MMCNRSVYFTFSNTFTLAYSSARYQASFSKTQTETVSRVDLLSSKLTASLLCFSALWCASECAHFTFSNTVRPLSLLLILRTTIKSQETETVSNLDLESLRSRLRACFVVMLSRSAALCVAARPLLATTAWIKHIQLPKSWAVNMFSCKDI